MPLVRKSFPGHPGLGQPLPNQVIGLGFDISHDLGHATQGSHDDVVLQEDLVVTVRADEVLDVGRGEVHA